MRNVVVPPTGWAILRRDGWYYPAYMIGDTPCRYAFIWWHTASHPCRFRQRALASDCATRYHRGLMHHAQLRDDEDVHDFVVLSEPNLR